jgi:hypothetical protein
VTAVVLDASALLALLLDEPGAARVKAALDGALMTAVNLAEIVSHYAKLGAAHAEIEALLRPLPIQVIPADAALSDLPPISRTPLIRSSVGGKVFDGEDATGVHGRVQAGGGSAAGEQRPAADADRGRTRDPAVNAEAVARDLERDCAAAATRSISGINAGKPGRVSV